MNMLEWVAFAIVAMFVAVRARLDADPKNFLVRMSIIAVAGWVAEDTVIRAYDFYHYAPSWSFFIDRVPLLIVLIWPVVIHSAWDLAGHVSDRHRALIGAAIVLADASLIEPISVRAGLWSWTHPGFFLVPPIGVLGWSFFAFAAMQLLARRKLWLLPVAGVAAVHGALIASWWALFRWIDLEISPWIAVSAAWSVALVLALKKPVRVPLMEMILRVPAAIFFYGLLFLHGRDEPMLAAFALAFAPPYLVLTIAAAQRPARPESVGAAVNTMKY